MQHKTFLSFLAALSATVLSDTALYAQAPTTPAPTVQVAGAQPTPPPPTTQAPATAQTNCGQTARKLTKLVRLQIPPVLYPKVFRVFYRTGATIDPTIFNPGVLFKPRPCPAIAAPAKPATVLVQAPPVPTTVIPATAASPTPVAQPQGVPTSSKP